MGTGGASNYWWGHLDYQKPLHTCTTNAIDNTVIFECNSQGVLIEHVYYDTLAGVGIQGDCTGDIVYTMPLHNGCTRQYFGQMHTTYDSVNGPCHAAAEDGVVDGLTADMFTWDMYSAGNVTY